MLGKIVFLPFKCYGFWINFWFLVIFDYFWNPKPFNPLVWLFSQFLMTMGALGKIASKWQFLPLKWLMFLASFRFFDIFNHLWPLGTLKALNPLDWLFYFFDENRLLGKNCSQMVIFTFKKQRFLVNFRFCVFFGHFWPLGILNP